jgi:hypothetical protein
VSVSKTGINQHNVGRIAEGIVSNELEYRGIRASALNKEGASAKADLLATKVADSGNRAWRTGFQS